MTSPVKTIQTNKPAHAPSWIVSAAKLLTLNRIRAQAIVLAVCLWGACAIDFGTPSLFDRAGNIKFQDFLPVYVSAKLVAQGRADELYNHQVTANAIQAIAHQPANVRLPNLYGPQVALFFVPLTRFSFPVAARIWVIASLLIFTACIYLLWRSSPGLPLQAGTVFLCAVAFPPLFHFFVRGQLSALVLACFTASFLAFRADRDWLAGVALGFLIFKPQFLVAIPLILLLSQAWKSFAGLILSAAAQLLLTRIYFGPAVMHEYFKTLEHVFRMIKLSELNLAATQMHSLRAFWTLLIPFPQIALLFYILTSIAAIAVATAIWKSSTPLAIRFSALTLAAVLVNPHLFVYDLLVLAPALMLLANWTLSNSEVLSSSTLQLLLYLAYILPLFGPLSRWTHLQISVPIFAALLWLLWRLSKIPTRKLAPNESAVV